MYRAVAYALVAIIVACLIGHVIAPIGSALDATLNTVARTLRTRIDHDAAN